MNHNPETELVAEDELRAALGLHKIDAATFEASVRARIQLGEAERANDPLANAPHLLRVAAAVLPLPIITGGKVTGSAVPLANASGFSKLLGYVAMPAISLFVLPAAVIFGAAKIHSIQRTTTPDITDQQVILNAPALWARRNKWFLRCLFCGTLALAWVGATALMLLLYLISVGVLLYVLSGFAKLRLANRYVIGQSCLMGLLLLGQVSTFSGIGDQDIHFIDQLVIAPVFLIGVLILLPFVIGSLSPFAGWRFKRVPRWILGGLFAALLVPMIVWFMKPILWPATPERIKNHVESFDEAPFSTVSWRQWEIVAGWAIEAKLDPDLSGARRLLAEEIAGEQNPFILGSAFRIGLVQPDQLGQLRDYDERRRSLLNDPQHVLEARPIPSLEQEDWVIRASALHNDLSPRDRDYLEKRLHVTLADLAESQYDVLATALRVTQLLEVIQRPIDHDQYRVKVHDWLRKFHSKKGGGFQVAGGFRQELNVPVGWVKYLWSPVGSVEATAHAVELMKIYGIPDGLDLNWVRSFLRPRFLKAGTEDKWITAVTLDRLNRLPGVTHPTWLEIVYYERSLIMAALLVALCIYATFSSPLPRRSLSAARSTCATLPNIEEEAKPRGKKS